MTSNPPWSRLKDVAAKQRDVFAQRLAATVRARDEAQRKLQTLLQYRSEYEGRLANLACSGIDAMALRNYQSFLTQLERAIEQQSDLLLAAQRDVHNAKVLWTAEHRRTESFQVLDNRHTEAQAEATRRLEQKQVDEWVTQTHHRRHHQPR